MDTVDILCRARALYAAAPSHAAHPAFPAPGTCCVVIAISKAGANGYSLDSEFHSGIAAMDGAIGGPNIVDWNTEHSTEEVLVAFDRAIAAQRLLVPDLTTTGREAVHA